MRGFSAKMCVEMCSYQYVGLDIEKCQFRAVPKRVLLAFAAGDPVVIFSDILLKSPYGQLLFFVRQPRGCPGKVGQDGIRGQGDPYGNYAFDDEHPFPGTQASVAIHVRFDAGGYEPGEGSRQQSTAIKDGGSEA